MPPELVAIVAEVPFIAFLLYAWWSERKERIEKTDRFLMSLEKGVEGVQVQKAQAKETARQVVDK